MGDFPDGRLRPTILDPKYAWSNLKNKVIDEYSRAMFTLEMQVWDLDDVKLDSFVFPEWRKYKMPRNMDSEWVSHHCWFCEAQLTMKDGDYVEEIGELWSEEMENTVLAHVDCIPEGVVEGNNDEWSMA